MTSALGLPPPTQPLNPSSGLGSSTELAMELQQGQYQPSPPSAGLANDSASPKNEPMHPLCFGAPHHGHFIWVTMISAPVLRFFPP